MIKHKILKVKKLILAIVFLIVTGNTIWAQTGVVTIEQDPIIPKLLDLKTEMGKENLIGDRYKIQIFSGDNSEASEVIMDFRNLDTKWPSSMVYETPNYKVWVGNFRNKLEADRALLKIKEYYPAAFRFRPERK